jgi:ATP-dependent protease ClpP protease subunit
MPDLDGMIEHLRRMKAPAAARPWYDIQAKAGTRKAQLRIYDDIGWMGTSAKSFGDELAALDADEIDLHLNSPGGNAWDGIAIYNSLRRHKARVVVTVDGYAASAASIIAMAGDEIRANRGAQFMVHDAWGRPTGNAAELVKAADALGKLSDSMAGIYAARAGGDVAFWRDAMRVESWYTAEEAVAVGLADMLVDDVGTEDADVSARFDLRMYAFAHAGRAAAPAPVIPVKPEPSAPPPKTTAAAAARRIHAASNTDKKGAGLMDPAKIREALGLAPDVSDDEVKAAAQAAFGLAAAPPAATPPEAGPTPTPAAAATKPGMMTIDTMAWDQQQERIKRLEAQAAKQARDERDSVLAQAVQDGKFPPMRKDHWARLWDADSEGTRQVIDTLAKNVVPVEALGYANSADDADWDAEFASLFPPAHKGA